LRYTGLRTGIQSPIWAYNHRFAFFRVGVHLKYPGNAINFKARFASIGNGERAVKVDMLNFWRFLKIKHNLLRLEVSMQEAIIVQLSKPRNHLMQ
jgi:hypothetical protein